MARVQHSAWESGLINIPRWPRGTMMQTDDTRSIPGSIRRTTIRSAAGYGEVEMHLHHNHMPPFPDTEETFRRKILTCMDDYARHGIFCLPDGSRRFAFIHGDWSLANARGASFCGVNDEIRILKECGCFADFTFPSLGDPQPRTINAMYYATSRADRPKSYERGVPVRVGRKGQGDLLMVSGIVGLRWASRTHLLRPSIEASNIDIKDYPFDARTDYWVNNAVVVDSQPNWLFIKIHTHGARDVDFDCLFGARADRMHTYLEERYNDGRNYKLHYVTAREMYNIVKAAEAGYSGDPNQYRDFEISRYVYLP